MMRKRQANSTELRPSEAPTGASGPSLAAYLLGVTEFESCLALAQRLVYEAGGRRDGQIALLICEHAPLVTIGREGSRAHLLASPSELDRRGLAVRWINRGGGCLVHAPGQLAVYPIVPLEERGWNVGNYLRRLERGIQSALAEVRVAAQPRAGRFGVWGRTGQVAFIGAAVKNWTTYHGAFVNVAPQPELERLVQSDPHERTPASSLTAERHEPVKITSVREALVRHLAEAFDCQRYHLCTGHPLLRARVPWPEGTTARAG